MSDIYLYNADETEFDNIGVCGALLPNEAKFNEIANGNSTLTLTHPRDEYGKFALIERGMILKAAVPVRTTPEITNGEYVTTVYEYTVLTTATKEQRKIWNTRDKTKDKRKCLKVAARGATIVVVKTFDNANYYTKVKYTYAGKKKNKTVTGFIDPDAISDPVAVTIPGTPDGMDEVADSWNIKDQLFRIESVEKTESEVNVTAHHISYDFMYNLTSYNLNGSATLSTALDGVFESCYEDHPFMVETNITSTLTGFHYADKDPITAMLDPDEGLVPRFNGEMVRDNYLFTVLDHAGTNRGYRIEYGKNMTGVSWQIDETSIAGAIRPYGETKNGNKLYLSHSWIANDDYTELTQVTGDDKGLVYSPRYYTYSDGTLTSSLPYTRIYALQGDDCKATVDAGDDAEADDITPAIVRTRLKDQALKAFADGADVPEVTIDVDIKQLGNSVNYADFADFGKVFLFDTVLVYHRRMGILADAVVSAIEWDVIQDELVGVTLGTIRDLSSSVASWQIAQINGGKIMPSTIPAAAIMPGSISAEQIMANTITAEEIAAGTITANEIATNSITANEIAAGTITATEIASGAITADNIASGTITATQIASGTITANEIASGTITANEIASGTITANEIAAGTITANEIAAGTITATEIAAYSITADNLSATEGEFTAMIARDAIIDTANIEDAAITNAKIAGAAVEEGNIKDGAITTAKIVDAAITNAKIGAAAITNAKIDDGAITNAKIQDATIEAAKIKTINADVINAGTLSADRLQLRGEDGLYYEMNVSAYNAGEITATQLALPEYMEHFHASNIVAGSITTSKVSADFGSTLDLTGNAVQIRTEDNAARLTVAEDAITSTVGDLSTISTQVTQNTDGLEAAITRIGDAESAIETEQKWLTFNDSYLTMGKTGDAFKVNLTNEQLSFIDNGQTVSYINGQRYYITDGEITNSLIIGKYKFVPQDNNHMSLVYTG